MKGWSRWWSVRSGGQDLLETSGPETIPNAILDMVVLVVGHRLGRIWNEST